MSSDDEQLSIIHSLNTNSFQCNSSIYSDTMKISKLNQIIQNLENRLNMCESIYKLSLNTTEVREKERNQNNSKIMNVLTNIDQRLTVIEQFLDNIPLLIKETISKSLQESNQEKQTQLKIKNFSDSISLQISELEKKTNTKEKAFQKGISSFKKEIVQLKLHSNNDSQIVEMEARLKELKKNQKDLDEMYNSLVERNK